MNILDRIVADKRVLVAERKLAVPTSQLEASPMFERPRNSLVIQFFRKKVNFIAEFKRKSPSKDMINDQALVEDVVYGYRVGGASGISVLTDTKYFGGTDEDLMAARKRVQTPLLRKDFIVDEYQLLEAKAFGADVVLLIAAVLKPEEVKRLAAFAQSLKLEVLLEVRDEEELADTLGPDIDIVGVNNRNLKTFEVSIDQSLMMADFIPDQFMKISESGLSDPKSIVTLSNAGYHGFLIGETFMKTENPGQACREFVRAVNTEIQKQEQKVDLGQID